MIMTFNDGVFMFPAFYQKGKDIVKPYKLEDFYTPYGFIFPLSVESLSLKTYFQDGVKGIDTASAVTCHFLLDYEGNLYRYFLATANDSVERAFVSRKLLSLRDDWMHSFSGDTTYEEQMSALWLKHGDIDKALGSFTRLHGRCAESFRKMTKQEILEGLKERGFTARYKFEDRVEATLEV